MYISVLVPYVPSASGCKPTGTEQQSKSYETRKH